MGEIILWEDRPSLIAYMLAPSIQLIVLSVILGVLTAMEPVFAILLVLALIFLPLVILWEYIKWKNTYFAITDSRVLTQYGVFGKRFAEFGLDRVQNVTIIEPFLQRMFGYGNLLFATAGNMGGADTDNAIELMSPGGAIIWVGLKDPTGVNRHLRDVIEAYKKKRRVEEIEQMAEILAKKEALVAKASHPQQGTPSQGESPPRTLHADSSNGGSQSIRDRLQELESLWERGLIKDDEYLANRRRLRGLL